MPDTKLTQREPTAEMIDAGRTAYLNWREGDGITRSQAIYRAMHDAAPSPEPLPAGDVARIRELLGRIASNGFGHKLRSLSPRRDAEMLSMMDAAREAGKLMDAVLALSRHPSPVQMLLFCPKCGMKHVDAPDERTPDWTNPPHKSHLCHGCGCIWRPADVPTEGVEAITTIGKADTIDLNAVSRHPTLDPAGEAVTLSKMLDELMEGLRLGAEPMRKAGCTNMVAALETVTAEIGKQVEKVKRALASSRDGRVEGLRVDIRGIALQAIKEARQAGESQEMLARRISERVHPRPDRPAQAEGGGVMRWLHEWRNPEKACERKGHIMRSITRRVYLYPPEGPFWTRYVADRAKETCQVCSRCGHRTETEITDRTGLNGLSLPSHMWDTLREKGRVGL